MEEFPEDLTAAKILQPQVEKYDEAVAASARLLRQLVNHKIRKALTKNERFVKFDVVLFNTQAVMIVMKELSKRFPDRVGQMSFSGEFQALREIVLSGVREYCLDLRVNTV